MTDKRIGVRGSVMIGGESFLVVDTPDFDENLCTGCAYKAGRFADNHCPPPDVFDCQDFPGSDSGKGDVIAIDNTYEAYEGYMHLRTLVKLGVM